MLARFWRSDLLSKEKDKRRLCSQGDIGTTFKTKLASEEIASKFTLLGSVTYDDATTIQNFLEFSDGHAFLTCYLKDVDVFKEVRSSSSRKQIKQIVSKNNYITGSTSKRSSYSA